MFRFIFSLLICAVLSVFVAVAQDADTTEPTPQETAVETPSVDEAATSTRLQETYKALSEAEREFLEAARAAQEAGQGALLADVPSSTEAVEDLSLIHI